MIVALGHRDPGVAGARGATGARRSPAPGRRGTPPGRGRAARVVVDDQDRLQRRHGLVRRARPWPATMSSQRSIVWAQTTTLTVRRRQAAWARSPRWSRPRRGRLGGRPGAELRAAAQGAVGAAAVVLVRVGGVAAAAALGPDRARAGGAGVLAAPGTSDPSPTTARPEYDQAESRSATGAVGDRFGDSTRCESRYHPPAPASATFRPHSAARRRSGWAGSACPAASTPAGPRASGGGRTRRSRHVRQQVACSNAWVEVTGPDLVRHRLRPCARPGAVAELGDVDRQRRRRSRPSRRAAPEAGEVLVEEPVRVALVALGRVDLVGRGPPANGCTPSMSKGLP